MLRRFVEGYFKHFTSNDNPVILQLIFTSM